MSATVRFQFQNTENYALVTGASSGIGLATAQALAEAGMNLILLARREDRLKTLKKQIEAHSKVKVEVFAVDISNPIQVDIFLNENKDLLAKTDILVNNAGLAKGVETFQNMNRNDFEDMIDTNVKGVFYMARGVLPFMISKNSGHIVNIGSVAGRWVYPGGAAYCASKFAVRALSEGLRMDLLGTNIRVTNIEPGMVETEFSLVRLQDPEKAKKVYEGLESLTPEDISESILWCLSRPSRVNIQELVIFPTAQAAVGQVARKL